MYWIWKTSSGEHVRHLADHAEYDRRSHLLRHVHRPRNCTHPISGLIQTAIPREGKDLASFWCPELFDRMFTAGCFWMQIKFINGCFDIVVVNVAPYDFTSSSIFPVVVSSFTMKTCETNLVSSQIQPNTR